MKNYKIAGLGLMALGLLASSCSDDLTIDDPSLEAYTKAFVEKYGIPEEGHKFNMAQRTKVTVKCSDVRDVQIVAEFSGKMYSFARYTGITGSTDVNFSIPRGTSQVYVVSGDKMLPVNIGGTIDLDKAGSYVNDLPGSRYEGTLEDYTFTELPEGATCGLVKANSDYLKITPGGTTGHMTIWELNHIIDKLDNEMPKKAYDAADWGYNTKDDVTYISVMYWDKLATGGKDIEIGMINTVDQTEQIPFYRTDHISNGSNAAPIASYLEDANNSVAEIEIRYSAEEGVGYQKQTHIKWNDTNYFHMFLPDMYKDVTFAPKLAAYCEVQAKFPNIHDYEASGSTRYASQGVTLPVYDNANPLPFRRAWEAFLYCYANDPANTQFTEADREALAAVRNFIPLKEYWAQHGMLFQYEHSYPISVTKIDDITYKIRFEGAVHENTWDYSQLYGNKLINPSLPGNIKYVSKGVSVALPQTDGALDVDPAAKINTTYAIYIKEVGGNILATSLQGSDTHALGGLRWICNEAKTSNCNNGIVGFDLNNDGKYSDVIIFKAGNGGGSQKWNFEPFTWIIAAEDLGNTEDVDFNDLVVGISFEDTNQATQKITVKPLAAGGIYPAYLAYTDGTKRYIVGNEIHKWLGQSTLDMYNTGETFDAHVNACTPCEFTFNKLDHSGNSFSIGATTTVTEGDKTYEIWTGENMGGFSIIVDKNNAHAAAVGDEIKLHEIDFSTWTDVNQLTAPGKAVNGARNIAPMMICVGGDWEWPSERTRIENAYPAFTKWIHNSSYRWYGKDLTGEDAYKPDLVTQHN